MSVDDFRGVFPYLVSPVDTEGKIRDEALARLVEHLIAADVHGLTPLGSTGEFAYLNWAQKRRVVEVTLAAAAGRVPVVLGEAGFGHVTAVDIDAQVLASVRAEADRLALRVQTVRHDLNEPLPPLLRTPPHRLVFIDPMYSLAGVELFLKGALDATGRQTGARIFLSLHLLSLGRAGLEQLEAMLARAGLAVDEIARGFNSYAVPPRLRRPLAQANRLLLRGAWGTAQPALPFFFSDALLLRQL